MFQAKHFDRAFLIGLVCLQAFLASTFYSREIAWYPAARWDQTVFLSEAYELEERVFAHGPMELVRAFWSNENPNGLLLPIENIDVAKAETFSDFAATVYVRRGLRSR